MNQKTINKQIEKIDNLLMEGKKIVKGFRSRDIVLLSPKTKELLMIKRNALLAQLGNLNKWWNSAVKGSFHFKNGKPIEFGFKSKYFCKRHKNN